MPTACAALDFDKIFRNWRLCAVSFLAFVLGTQCDA